MHKKEPDWCWFHQTMSCYQQKSRLAAAAVRCAQSFRAGFEVPEPSEYAGLIKQSLKSAPVTMVTCDAGKKVNFPHDYCTVWIKHSVCSSCKHISFSQVKEGFARDFVQGLCSGCANSVMPAVQGGYEQPKVLRRGRILCQVPCCPACSLPVPGTVGLQGGREPAVCCTRRDQSSASQIQVNRGCGSALHRWLSRY